jgi:hypothetical protein
MGELPDRALRSKSSLLLSFKKEGFFFFKKNKQKLLQIYSSPDGVPVTGLTPSSV